VQGLAGKVAVITGAATGIGAEAAHRLAAEGTRVVVNLSDDASFITAATFLVDGGISAAYVTPG
jgi:short-subunit dehydrogenase involved in D-alanine esterification of teichoic acids